MRTQKGHRCYLHIYFDSIKAALDEKNFGHRLLTEYEELCSGNIVKAHQKDYTTMTSFQKEIVELFGLIIG